jgi:murein DD-endopeptidase MepM/ murein hydrolase activator NlpD
MDEMMNRDRLKGNIENLADQLVSYQGIIERKNQDIKRLLEDIDKVAALQVVGFTDPETVENIVKDLDKSSPFMSPFRVTSRFGEGTGFGYRHKHLGTDLACSDLSVYPMWDGSVVDIGISDIYGKWVLIKHSDYIYTKYCHLQTIFFTALPGEQVSTDTRIGIEGSTGRSTGIHLHLELRIRNPESSELTPVDIYPFLRR